MAETKTAEVKTIPKTTEQKASPVPKSIYGKLLAIQTEIKCPKNLYNSYGNYNYRNAETILETVKPMLQANNCTIILSDEVVPIGDGRFLKATVRFIDLTTEKEITNSALAELSEHKGMSKDQETGCASSYARKYALNGLFLLDDVKDADTDEFAKTTGKAQQNTKPVTSNDKVKWQAQKIIKAVMFMHGSLFKIMQNARKFTLKITFQHNECDIIYIETRKQQRMKGDLLNEDYYMGKR